MLRYICMHYVYYVMCHWSCTGTENHGRLNWTCTAGLAIRLKGWSLGPPNFEGPQKSYWRFLSTAITVNRGFCKWRSSATASMQWMKDNEQEVCQIWNIVFFHTKNSRLVSTCRLWHTKTHTHKHIRVSQNPTMPMAPLLSFVRWPKYVLIFSAVCWWLLVFIFYTTSACE